MKTIKDCFDAIKETGLDKLDDGHYVQVLTPLNAEEGWVGQFYWNHHDGEICEYFCNAPTYEEVCQHLHTFIYEYANR